MKIAQISSKLCCIRKKMADNEWNISWGISTWKKEYNNENPNPCIRLLRRECRQKYLWVWPAEEKVKKF